MNEHPLRNGMKKYKYNTIESWNAIRRNQKNSEKPNLILCIQVPDDYLDLYVPKTQAMYQREKKAAEDRQSAAEALLSLRPS